jgi:hypothetical protein
MHEAILIIIETPNRLLSLIDFNIGIFGFLAIAKELGVFISLEDRFKLLFCFFRSRGIKLILAGNAPLRRLGGPSLQSC